MTMKVRYFTFLLLTIAFFLAQNNAPYFMKSTEKSWARTDVRAWASVDELESGEGSKSRYVGLALLGALGVLGLFFGSRYHLKIKSLASFLIGLYLMWIFLSIGWADDPFLTFKKIITFSIICLASLAAAKNLSLREMVSFIFVGCSLLLFVGIVAEVLRGEFHPLKPPASYWFLGAMQPTMQPQVCGMLFLASAFLVLVGGKRLLHFPIMSMAIIFLFLSRNRSFLGAALLCGILLWAMISANGRRIPRGIVFMAGAIWSLCVLYFLAGDYLVTSFQNTFLLGREAESTYTLSGRTDLWKVLQPYFADSPLIGHGFGSFVASPRMLSIARTQGWGAPNVHNGYIDLALSLGMIGLTMWVLLLLLGMKYSLYLYRNSGMLDYAYSFAIFVYYCFVLIFVVLDVSLLVFVVLFMLAKLYFVVPDGKKTPALG